MIPSVEEHEYLYQIPKSFATKAIHSGQDAEAIHGSVNVPIHLSTSFKQKEPGEHQPFEYLRWGNPTRAALEQCIADLENNKYCITFSSGSAAMVCVTNTIRAGEQILCCDAYYSATQYIRNFTKSHPDIDVSYVDDPTPENVKLKITPRTRVIWIDSPANPTLQIIDIRSICQIAKDAGILSVVDNTIATPYFQTPSDLGADITINSGTKFIGGHSDLSFGSLTCSNKELYDKLYFFAKSFGACPSTFDCWLVQRSLKTLELRMKQATKNALIFAKYLEGHPNIEKVIYPGLPSHPQHELVKKQMRGSGALMCCYIKGGQEKFKTFLKSLKIFTVGMSQGGVESLIGVPSYNLYHDVPEDKRIAVGITDNIIRLSIGIEDVEDLIADFERAFKISHP